MTPELVRALRANPRLRKKLRERTVALKDAVTKGKDAAVLDAARRWAEAEQELNDDVARKVEEPPKHRISFDIEEHYFQDFCKTAAENSLSPDEVARRYCVSGFTFSEIVWSAIAKDSLGDLIVLSPRSRGLNLAQVALPNFVRERTLGL